MRLISRPSRRAGFTLIELMTVIGIIAILVALVAGGIGKVRTSQQTAAAEQTINKLQIALDQQWKAVLDQCKQDRLKNTAIFAQVVSTCGGDADRAEALWAYMNLTREFPQTFAEANTTLTIGTIPPLQPRKTFASVPPTSTGNPTGEAAVLLYLNLAEKGNRGMGFVADDVTASAQSNFALGGTNYRVFVDPWGTPITFLRFACYQEIQQQPYVNPNSKFSPDPLDPLSKLSSWSSGPTVLATLTQNLPSSLGNPSVTFGTNKLISVISVGPNQTPEGDPLGNNAAGNNPTMGTDDLYGYRLRKLGQKSN